MTTHTQVARLYRHALRLTGAWTVSRDIFIEEATKLRAEFESNRSCPPEAQARLMKEAREKMVTMAHPDKYCIPGMPGGSLFMRNPPLPMSVCFPDGDLPDDAPKREVNPDWTTKEEGGYASGSGQVIVDFTTKSMT